MDLTRRRFLALLLAAPVVPMLPAVARRPKRKEHRERGYSDRYRDTY